MSLAEALVKRRSIRKYRKEPISREDLSDLAFAAYGKTVGGRKWFFRTAPSAGALYPVEVYVLVNSVEGVAPGFYHYSAEKHALKPMKSGSFGKAATDGAWGQRMAGESAVTFFLSIVFMRCARIYGERAGRYVYMDAGHVSQNIYLMATSLGLGSVSMAAFNDDALNDLLGFDGARETVVYLHAVGKPA